MEILGIVAGTVIVIMSFAHIIYGEKKQIPELKRITNDSIMIGSVRIMIFQGGILLFAAGLFQLLDSIEIVRLSGVAVYFPLGIVLINFITSLIIIGLNHREVMKVTIPQFVIFFIIIILQVFSLK